MGSSTTPPTVAPLAPAFPGHHRRLTLAKWERVTEWPLLGAVLLFLIAYATPIIWPHVDLYLLQFSNHVIVVTWVAFAVDYLVRLALSTERWEFVKHNVVDLLSIALPLLRPLRLLRLVAALSVLSRVGILTLRGRLVAYTVGFSAITTFAAALTITQAERAAGNPGFASFGNGLWFSIVTVATVGYGDIVVVTTLGRVIAVVLMLVGVLLVGAVSASLASWLVQRTLAIEAQARDAESVESTENDVEALLQQITVLHDQVDALNSSLERHSAAIRANQRKGG